MKHKPPARRVDGRELLTLEHFLNQELDRSLHWYLDPGESAHRVLYAVKPGVDPNRTLTAKSLDGLREMKFFTVPRSRALDRVLRQAWQIDHRRPKRVPQPIQAPPGRKLHRIGASIFSQRTFETVIEPVLSDLQIEYREAVNAGATYQAMWVRYRGCVSFWMCLARQVPVSLTRVLRAVVEGDRGR